MSTINPDGSVTSSYQGSFTAKPKDKEQLYRTASNLRWFARLRKGDKKLNDDNLKRQSNKNQQDPNTEANYEETVGANGNE